MEAVEPPAQRPPARSLQTLMIYIHLLRGFHSTGHFPPPTSRIFRIPSDLVGEICTSTSFPDLTVLANKVVNDGAFGVLRERHPNTLAHHFCIALFGQTQLSAVCTFIQTTHAPYRYNDVPRVPTPPDIKIMARLRKALDAVVPLYMERARMEMFVTWREAYPGATGEPVFERGEDEAAVRNIERAFLRMWTIGQIFSRSRVDMFRLRNRAMPHRYDQGNQDLFWEFMERIPPGEVDILRGCTARLNMEESWLAYVLGEQENVSVENPSQTRRVARNIRDLLFWSYDFGPDAVVLE